jgi:hypothetical protein
VRLVGRGHEAIRATHPKTLEFTADTDLTGRGTCIVAVGVRPVGDLPGPLAGRVRITIDAGGESFALLADANSAWDPAGPAVVRRGPLRLPGTLAVNADAAAADLPRELVAALADPRAEVRITLDPVAGSAAVVLLAVDPVAPDNARLRAELDAADAVLAEDDGARRLVAAATKPATATALRLLVPGADLPAGRVLVIATAELPGRSLHADGRRVEVLGLPVALAAAAAVPGRAPITMAAGADVRAALRSTPAGHCLLLDTDRRRLPELLGAAQQLRGAATAVVVQDFADPVVVDISAPTPMFAGATRLWCCFGPAAPGAALDPAVQAAVARLLADGVATKPAARALAALTGWPQRQAYAEVVAQTRRRGPH